MTAFAIFALAAYFTLADYAASRVLLKNRAGALLIWLFAVAGVVAALLGAGFNGHRSLLTPTFGALFVAGAVGVFGHWSHVRKARPAVTV